MNNRGLALIGFKILGLVFLAQSVVGAFGIPWILQSDGMRGIPISFVVVPLLVAALGGLGIWMGADRLASRLFADSAETACDGKFVCDPFVVALAIIGAWLLAGALPGIGKGISLFLTSRGHSGAFKEAIWTPGAKSELVAALVRSIVGYILLRRPGAIAARVAGTTQAGEPKGAAKE